VVVIGTAAAANADVIALYDFGTTDSPTYASADAEGNSAAGDFAPAPGLGSTGNWNSTSNGINTATGDPAPEWSQKPNATASTQILSYTNGDYWTFTVTPNPGQELNLTSLTFQITVANSGIPISYYLSTNVSGFDAPVGTPVNNATGGFGTVRDPIDLSGVEFQGVTTPIEIRMYLWNTAGGGTSGSRWGFDNITLNGTVAPEPTTLALLTLGGLALARRGKHPA
jgi:hypothetical protein